jgi:hypothetical protein
MPMLYQVRVESMKRASGSCNAQRLMLIKSLMQMSV